MELLKLVVTKLFAHIEIIIPAGLTIFGWWFIYSEGERLAKRNETRDLFSSARKILNDTSVEAESVWMSASHNLSEVDNAKLVAYCAEFELCLNQLNRYYCIHSVSSRDIFSLRRALTCVPYPEGKVAASNQKRIKIIKTIASEISLTLLDSTYEAINTKPMRKPKRSWFGHDR